MNIFKIDNVFSDEEIINIKSIIDQNISSNNIDFDPTLGRIVFSFINFKVPKNIETKITQICNDLLGIDLTLANCGYAEYNNLYGNPNLPPHFDGDNSILVFACQIDSNTSWNLGVDLQAYDLQDNSALIFNPNEYAHWRPNKIFNDGEYVKMLFVRFYDAKNQSNYSHKQYLPNDDIFKEIRKIREDL